ncbi:hypothetical protein V5O48_019670, partial [Marasmius crinis-equi]
MPPTTISQPSLPSTSQPPSSTPSIAPPTTPVNASADDNNDDDDNNIRLPKYNLPASGFLTEGHSREIITQQQEVMVRCMDKIKELRTEVADLKVKVATRGPRRGRTSKSAA